MDTKNKELSLKACSNGDICILINGEETYKIHDNKTSDQEIFNSLKYEPYCTYKRGADTPDDGVNKSVFSEIQALFDSLISGINNINQNSRSDGAKSESNSKD
jgi:hypothetical protein